MVDQGYSCSVYCAKYAGSSSIESAGEFLACDTLSYILSSTFLWCCFLC